MTGKFKVNGLMGLIVLGTVGGGCTGGLLLLLGVFTDLITTAFCAIAGALVVPVVVNSCRVQKQQEEERIEKQELVRLEVAKSHDIEAVCMATFDSEARELDFTDDEFQAFIDAHRHPDGSICQAGNVTELWSIKLGSPMSEVREQIMRGRSARWLQVFNGKQVVAVIDEN